MIELLIQVPSEPDRTERLEMPLITLGRDPTSVVRFEMTDDLEVSTRHAEISEDEDGAYSITDKGSTNGTWVNNARVRGTRRIYPGDVVQLGRTGPRIRVVAIEEDRWLKTVENQVKLPPIGTEHASRRQHTREFMITMVETRTRSFKAAMIAILIAVVGLGIGGWLYARTINTEDPQLWSDVTAPSIRLANDDAVVLVESQVPGQRCASGCEGTGFAISPSGLIVTNRHVVMQGGTAASRIRVKFANMGTWVAARFVVASPTVDLAIIQVSQAGTYPSVVGLSETGPDLAVGSSVLTIGFPLGTLLRMEGQGASAVARTTVSTGSIGKVLPAVFQIDAFADHGSSGSPVFDRHGHVIGVITAGIEDPSAKIVYVVPSDRIVELRARAAAK